ncbi:hypothetical protein JKP75_04985 [Blastococcus sp. TML/M2B]|uniref:hypothetical protein n=1 Tax=unclassified Blastococcus TaxID=2619396 RepID=UPI00190D63EF|nr:MULTISPECIES: hypothetical protein [unclassified Blastococcus]MBN1091987.1 hypothetical protein [Blastococcus sp. TML/M2B]MBN1097911.1 hypothetical protein [Blastococcus sp. TML/C7B]
MRSRAALVPAVVLALAATACGHADGEVGVIATVTPSSSSAAPTTAAVAPIDAGAELNERGNIVKAVGEPGGIRRTADPEAPTVLTFTVEDMVINPECDSGFELAPATANYLGIRMRVETTPDYDPRQLRTISEYDFAILDADGTPLPDVIGNGQVCFGEEDELSHRRFGPGLAYEGWVVLDMPIRTGTLVYQPADQPNGWEWAF